MITTAKYERVFKPCNPKLDRHKQELHDVWKQWKSTYNNSRVNFY